MVSKGLICVFKEIGSVRGWQIKIMVSVYYVWNGPQLAD